MFQSLEFCRLNSYPPYYTVPWTHFYGSIVTPIPYKMKKYIKMKERYVTIIKKKKMWRNWKKWKKMKGMRGMKGIFLSFLWFLFIPQFIGTGNVPGMVKTKLGNWKSMIRGHSTSCAWTKYYPIFNLTLIPLGWTK